MKVGSRSFGRFVLPLILLLSWGCAAMDSSRAAARLDRSGECRGFLARLDEATERAGVGDASSFRVAGFPYLRTSRFLAAMKDRVKTDGEKAEWFRLMRRLDEQSREKEILNLPESGPAQFGLDAAADSGRKELIARARSCSDDLFRRESSLPGFFDAVSRELKAPDEYSSLRRGIGLYPLFSIPVNAVTERVRTKIRGWYDKKIEELPVKGSLRSYAPREGTGLTGAGIAQTLESAADNPLRVPILQEGQERGLAAFFAPVYVQDVAGLYDRIGRVYWDADKPGVDLLKPTVYYYISHALLRERPVLQINYVVWYSERAGEQSPRIERGRIDGLTLRVSLGERGAPFMVDMMNNCGCYSFFSPSREAVLRPKPRPRGPGPFVPQWLPEAPSGMRLGVRINSGWHQVERLMAVDVPENAIEYDLVPYALLESLPAGGGTHRSMFDARGIAPGTERIEPLIFFSMGIPSIGSMRQRGHHAVEFTGRAHFDDPRLFEENFIFR
ncbi:MAG: hypothetical protein WAW37_16675 [Syntrophobacteraceae bacterium]